MSYKRVLSFLLSIIMLIMIIPSGVVSAEKNPDEASRTVYLHAQKMNPEKKSENDTINTSIVYTDELAEIYYAIDEPNKGGYNDDGTRKAPWYDLNGYTVKIYFDPDYLEFVTPEGNNKKPEDNQTPFNIEIPNLYASEDEKLPTLEEGDQNIGDDSGANVPGAGEEAKPGYYDYEHGTIYTDKRNRHPEAEAAEDEGLAYAYVTVFFQGGYIPDGDAGTWENHCMLPLKPRKTGTTDVKIEIYTDSSRTAELLGKDKETDDKNAQIFDIEAVNGGRHTLIIRDKAKPAAPEADPPSGSYPEGSTVTTDGITLKYEDGCVVYYTIDGSNPKTDPNKTARIYDPEKGIDPITSTTIIKCYAVRESDDKKSDIATFEYEILPRRPVLFTDEFNAINEPTYSESQYPYKVYTTDSDVFGDISTDSEIYYTTNITLDSANPVITEGHDDPATGWVKVNKGNGGKNQFIEISEMTTLRLITGKVSNNEEIYSAEAKYYLGLRPAPVQISEPSGHKTDKINVTLKTETKNARIFYTIDGRDPIQYGQEYLTDPVNERPITLTHDSTLYAVAYYEGQYSVQSSAWYLFDFYDDYGVKAYYPSGVYEGSVSVTLTPNNPSFRIRYKLDNSDEWKWYDDPDNKDVTDGCFYFDKDAVITAQAVEVDNDGNIVSGEERDPYVFTYTVKPKPPTFSPDSTQHTNQKSIWIYTPESNSDNTDRYQLWYTEDGSSPLDPDKRKIADLKSDSVEIAINDYKVVSAVVVRIDGDKESYSDVVVHSYDLVKFKPVQPIATLSPVAENYIREIGDHIGYFTEFAPVTGGTKIHYTIAYNGEFCPDPVPNTDGTEIYSPGDKIELKGKTTIKAVAKNVYGVSDIAVFTYTVSPEAPQPAPSANILDDDLPLIPVRVLAIEDDGEEVRNKVRYTLSDKNGNVVFENEFVSEYPISIDDSLSENDREALRVEENKKYTTFYIDTKTGLAYRNSNKTGILGKEKSDIELTDTAVLNIKSILDGVESITVRCEYSYNADNLAAPYADMREGTYEEKDIDGKGNMLLVSFDSLNDGDTIEYMEDNSGKWEVYSKPIAIPAESTGFDKTFHIRAVKDGHTPSKNVSISYYFVPMPPIITLPSGRYTNSQTTYFEYDDIMPDVYPEVKKTNGEYEIWYRANGDPQDFLRNPRTINKTMAVKAYVYNTKTNQKSAETVHYYVIEDGEEATGSVGLEDPYDAKPDIPKRIAAHELGKGKYAEGIKMYPTDTTVDADVHYVYEYTREDDGSSVEIYDDTAYDPSRPIIPTQLMDNLKIQAYLYDDEGKILGSDTMFYFDFIHLKIPETSLEYPENKADEYKKGTKYHVVNDYPSDKNVILYYTTNGSDPRVDSDNRVEFSGKDAGPEEELNKTTTVKTVYYSACGECDGCSTDIKNCTNYVFGEVGVYKYPVPTKISGGGGGGGGGGLPSGSGGSGAVDKSRRYTVDIFGYEHPTHIGYINGYPDGSVQPDGKITREEIAAILYRIKNHEYEKPFVMTGEVFPDVSIDRWSVKEIEYMAEQGVIIGYPDKEFKPARNLTRAEFAALVSRFANLNETGGENRFPDLQEDHWAYDNILALFRAGLITGYEDGTFRPENQITRAEVMTIVNKLLGRNPLEKYVKSLEFNPFNDLNPEKWYYVTVLEATITHNYWLNDDNYEYLWEDWK